MWEPPASEMQDKVLLNGHTGWVRALAAEGRWLFRCASRVEPCREITLQQWHGSSGGSSIDLLWHNSQSVGMLPS